MHGKVFKDAILASYFDKMPWYQPPYWEDSFEVELNDAESTFITRIDKEIARLQSESNGGNPKVGMAINLFQFGNLIPKSMGEIDKNGFLLIDDPSDQLFDKYISNQQSSIPQFVSTDLILQQLHYLYGTLENEIEAIYLADMLKSILEIINVELYSCYEKTLDSLIEQTIEESLLYYSIPYGIISGNKTNLIGNYNRIYYEELGKVLEGKGTGSKVIKNEDFNYNVFVPRAQYTKNELTRKYYKALTWLQKINLCLNDEEEFSRAILIAYIISKSDDLQNSYKNYVEVKTYFSSQREQFTFWDLAKLLDKVQGIDKFEDLFSPTVKEQIKNLLELQDGEKCQIRVSLMPVERQNLYTDLSQLNNGNKAPSPVQLFAALGNEAAKESFGDPNEAQAIMNDLLKISTQEEAKSMDWLSTLLSSLNHGKAMPEFMQRASWNMKGLNASLASWVLLNQRVNLQLKNAPGSKCEMDTSKLLVGYVEPNIAFWNAAITLIENTHTFLEERQMLSADFKRHLAEHLKLLDFFKRMSEKEINQVPLTSEDFSTIASIGTILQRQAIELLNAGINPNHYLVSSQVAYTTKVFGGGQNQNIYAGPGLAHSLLVPVKIGDHIYLTRGAVYSYYELSGDRRNINQQIWRNLISDSSGAGMHPFLWDYYISTAEMEDRPLARR